MNPVALALLLAATAPAADPAPVPAPDAVKAALRDLDALATKTLEASGVPGFAVAVVHRGEVVFLKGYGVRKAGTSDPVGPDTVFPIASLSKPLSATVLAGLVGDGAIQWDDRVSDRDPAFRLCDPWVTRELTFRDLLCHRSGLPDHAGDLLEDMGYDRAEVLRRLRFLPLGKFRADYAYTNFGFSEAGFAAAKAVGKPWEDVAADRLLKPLGMTKTSYRFADYEAAPDRAVAHVRVGSKKWEPKFTRRPDAQAPAGGASSTARDLATWVKLLLADGTFDGRPVIAAAALAETHAPQIVTGTNPETKRASFYGLGWNVGYDPELGSTLSHSGAFSLGVRSAVYLLPNRDLGIVVLCPAYPSGIPEGLALSFLDTVVLGKPRRDWVALADRQFEMMLEDQQKATVGPAKAAIDPALSPEAYTGRYANDYYGEIEVAAKGAGFILRLSPAKREFPLRHHDRDVFAYQPDGENAAGLTAVTFTVGPDRTATRVTLANLDAEGLGTFVRVK